MSRRAGARHSNTTRIIAAEPLPRSNVTRPNEWRGPREDDSLLEMTFGEVREKSEDDNTENTDTQWRSHEGGGSGPCPPPLVVGSIK